MEQEGSWVFFFDFCSKCRKSLSYCCYLIDILFVESRHSEVTDILEKVIKLKKDFDESFLLGKSGKLFIARCVEMCLILHHFLIIFFNLRNNSNFHIWFLTYLLLLPFFRQFCFAAIWKPFDFHGGRCGMGNPCNYERGDLWISNYGVKPVV